MTNQYSDDTKAAVVAALMTGQSVSSVAREYNIPKGTVSSWKDRLGGVATQKREVGDELLDYLHANLRALKAQAEVFADPVWLKQQEASQLGLLHGIMTDKAVRLLEAFGKDAGDNEAEEV